ncbi:sigma-54 dependent transcriptional regulator [Roseomonas sp. CECT 9278]|uniref:sigma-54-dependent transcriptional regulator n=1 Tax=Roseomonas sp. CECT 9278 TaxID=2845823 RepID=UPI001E37453B|nr:sigma-54 dependent transcriptional regulator [Roseomonas sp. CECT 9278]CAH0139047.1 Regulatory protein AtoC [Roseomonas sp. CECT 9278]
MTLAVLIIEDEETLARNLVRYLQRQGFDARSAPTAAGGLAAYAEFGPDVVMLDLNLPDASGLTVLSELRTRDPAAKVIVMTGHGSIETAVEAMKAGAFDYVGKPVALGEVRILIEKAAGQERMEGALSYYRGRDARGAGAAAILGDSPPVVALRQSIARLLVAERNMQGGQPPAVLVRGETGTGKELVARALHFDGPRRDGPFIELNCSTLPAHLLEAELFGHERGAFTDAKERRIGLVEAAQGGTLFLDEIGDVEPAVQVKLLKLLEDRMVRRIGAVRDRQVDVRFVSATHRDLEALVREGRFRADLFYRLRVVEMEVPPLRARGADVLTLARHFLAESGRRYGKPALRLDDAATAVVARHAWPGNVRELRNAMEQAALSTDGDLVGAGNLALAPVSRAMTRETLPGMERELIERALERSGGNVSRAARDLGISRDTLRYRLARRDDEAG